MHLSLNFAKAIMPCIMTGLQALIPVNATEAIMPLDAPVAMQLAANPHKAPNAQITYAEMKKRLQEAKSEVVIQTYEAAALKGQTAVTGPALIPA